MRSSHVIPILAAAFFAGCISFTTNINIHPDGTGTIVQTTTVSPEIADQMKQMMAGFASDSADKQKKPKELFSVEDAKAAAATMGESVTFVQADKIKTHKAVGIRATYRFKDITKVRIGQTASGPGQNSASKKESDQITFSLTASGNHKVLTAVFPKPKKPAASQQTKEATKETTPEGGKATSEPDEKAVVQMKEMLKGMRIATQVTVDGKLIKTSSPYVEKNTVTLMDIQFDKMLDNQKALTELAKTQKGTFEDAKKVLRSLKGIKVNLEPEITIEFSK